MSTIPPDPPSSPVQVRRATWGILFCCVIWGASYFSQQYVVAEIGEGWNATFAYFAVRFGIAALLFPVLFPSCVRQIGRRTLLDAFYLSIPSFLTIAALVTGLQKTTPTVSSFLCNLCVVFAPLLGVLFFRERVTLPLWLGVGLSIAGVWIMTQPQGGGFGIGEGLSILCAAMFSVQMHLTKKFVERTSPLHLAFLMTILATVYSAGLLAATAGGRSIVRELPGALWDGKPAAAMLFNAIFGSVVSFVIYNHCQRHVTPTRAGILFMTEPVFAAVFSVLFIGETMTVPILAGGAMILLGNLACEVLGRKSEKKAVVASISE